MLELTNLGQHLTSKHLVFPQPRGSEVRPQPKCPVGQLHFRVVVTKSVETSAPPGGGGGPPGGGGALRPRV